MADTPPSDPYEPPVQPPTGGGFQPPGGGPYGQPGSGYGSPEELPGQTQGYGQEGYGAPQVPPPGYPQAPQPGGYPPQPGAYPPQPGAYPPQPGAYPPQPGYGPPPGYGPQPAYGYGYGYGAPPGQSTEPMAIISLVSSIVGVLLVCCYVGVIGTIAGVVLGLLARKKIADSNGAIGGDGLALAGIIVGAIGTVILIALVVLRILAIGSFYRY